MSFDLEVWSVRPVVGEYIQPFEGWIAHLDCWSLTRGRGALQIWKSERIWPEDIRDDIAAELPGIGFVTRITASGEATKKVVTQVKELGRRVALACHGVLFDPQDETLIVPRGMKRFLAAPRGETFSITQLSWWSVESETSWPARIGELVPLLERLLPEALPRRYGLWEPPQHSYDETGRAHLVQFLRDHLHETIVWYPARPVIDVSVSLPEPVGPTPRGFRAHHMSLSVEASLLDQPGWQSQLRRVWHELSRWIRPFYGDVRTLSGYVGRRGAITAGTELHPVRGWWWRGVPHAPGGAVVLGPEYQRLWPDFMATASLVDGLAFLDAGDWRHPTTYRVPAVLVPHDPAPAAGLLRLNAAAADRRLYADAWPFEGPFAIAASAASP